jgi:hypothetical protein
VRRNQLASAHLHRRRAGQQGAVSSRQARGT